MSIIVGTKAEIVINHLLKIDVKKRSQAIEIKLDMANSMNLIAKKEEINFSFKRNLLYLFKLRFQNTAK